MFCLKCQKENPDVAKFCIKCGANLSSGLNAQQSIASKSQPEKPLTLKAENKQYPYKMKTWYTIVSLLLFIWGGYAVVSDAISNDRGLIINGIIKLSASNATVFLWVLSVFCVFACIFFIRLLLTPSRTINLGADKIVMPRSLFATTNISIPYKSIVRMDIKSIVRMDIQNNKFINVYHANGMTSIMQFMLPNNAAFEDICSAIRIHAKSIKP